MWFVINKILEDLDNTVFFNDNIVNADSDNITFFSDGGGLVNVDLNNVNHNNVTDDDNFHDDDDDDDTETIIHVRDMAWCNRFKQYKACKKEMIKELINACSMASNKMVELVHVIR